MDHDGENHHEDDSNHHEDESSTTGTEDITRFISSALETLSAKRSELDSALAESERVKVAGDERVQEVTKEAAHEHMQALDAEEGVRTAYNQALTEVLDKKVLTPDALAKLGYKRAGGRKGRKPSSK